MNNFYQTLINNEKTKNYQINILKEEIKKLKEENNKIVVTNNANNITNNQQVTNNITNNQKITNNNLHIHLNNFGSEDLSHLPIEYFKERDFK